MLTVKEALKIGGLRNAKVIAGMGGLNRIIKYVTVMEVPDIGQWLKGDDFIITSFYAIKDNTEAQCKLITELKRLNSAAIAVKTERFIEKISAEVIEVANRENFPVIEIPKDVTYIDIITPLMQRLFQIKDHSRMVEEYINDIIFHAYRTKDSIIERGKTLGYDIEKGYFIIMSIHIDNFESIAKKYKYNEFKLNLIKEELYKLIYKIAEEFKERAGMIDYLMVRSSSSIELLLQGINEQIIQRYEDEILKSIIYRSSLCFKDINIIIGIGNIGEGPEGIEKGYEEANSAIRFGKIVKKDRKYYKYDDMAIFNIIFDKCSDNIKYLVDSTLGKIKNDDKMVSTLIAYFNNNEDINLASQELCIHKNTLKYRLNNIKSMTNLDIKNIDDKFKLYLGTIAYNIMSEETNK